MRVRRRREKERKRMFWARKVRSPLSAATRVAESQSFLVGRCKYTADTLGRSTAKGRSSRLLTPESIFRPGPVRIEEKGTRRVAFPL